jgi:hypothetical protein
MSDGQFLRVLTRELHRIRRIATAHPTNGGPRDA